MSSERARTDQAPLSRAEARASVRRRRPSASWRDRGRRHARTGLAISATTFAFAICATLALAPPAPPSEAEVLTARIVRDAQRMTVDANVADTMVARDGFEASTGPETLIASGTNHDWARLVMFYAGWPASEGNITVFTRWMRQENGADNWWNRNNPLNNGWGSGGGSGLGSYDTLDTAAQYAAKALLTHKGYAAIRAGFASSAPTAEIEAAIWASPWASSHYANGAHWHYTPVAIVKAPASAWGR